MSKEKYTEMHIVISPQDKGCLSDWLELLKDFLDKYYHQWMASFECGENADNGVTHYDVVGWRKTPERGDNETDRIRKWLKILKGTDEYKRAVKCYGIADGELEWQVGYSRKEDGKYLTSDVFDCNIDQCIQLYKKNPNRKNERIKERIVQNQKWTVDNLVDNYVKYLQENEKKNERETWIKFRKENKEKIKYSVFTKINKISLDEYLEAYELENETCKRMDNSIRECSGFMLKY